MRDAARDLADRVHLLGMTQLRLGLDAAGDLGFERGGALAHPSFQLPVQLRKRRFARPCVR